MIIEEDRWQHTSNAQCYIIRLNREILMNKEDISYTLFLQLLKQCVGGSQMISDNDLPPAGNFDSAC